MPALQTSLPGLFSTSAQADHLCGLDPLAAIRMVASALLSAAQHCVCPPDAGEIDRKVSEDPRFRTAVSQAVTLSLWVNDKTLKAASDRNGFLTHHLRLRGKGGIPGLLAQAALLLGQASQAANDPEIPSKALDLIEQAIVSHALRHGLDPRQARADHQLRLLNAANTPSRRVH